MPSLALLARAHHDHHLNWALITTLAVLAAIAWYAIACAAAPFRDCWHCAGTGRNGVGARSRCKHCDGTGLQLRYGRRAYNHLTRTRHARPARRPATRHRRSPSRAARGRQPVEGPPMTRTHTRPKHRGLALALVAGLVVAILAARHRNDDASPPAPHAGTSSAAAALRTLDRPARAAGPPAPARLPTRLRPWAGVQLRPGLDR